jgi:hypothetical protein
MEPASALLSPLFSEQALSSLVFAILFLLGMALFLAGFTFVLRLKNERDSRLWARLKEAWEPALFEALVNPSALKVLWEKVDPRHHLLFLEFVLDYAQRLGGAERKVLRKAVEPHIHEILPHLNHGRMGKRARAVQTLGTLGLPTYVEEMQRAVHDPSPFVSALAARLLAHEMGAEVAAELCGSLHRFENFRSWYLVDMVVAMGPEAVPELRVTLENRDLPIRSRAVAADALSALGDFRSADLAAELAIEEESPELLAALLRLLAQVGTAKHSPAARAHLDSEEFFVRAGATRTLAELGEEEDLPLLVEKVGDPSAWVRMAAARGVYRLGGKEALDALNRGEDPATPLVRSVLAEEARR